MNNIEKGVLALVIGVFLLVLFTIISVVKEEKENEVKWSSFKRAHNCEIIGYAQGSVFTNGLTTHREPDKIGWKCDNRMTYWRNER